MELLGLPLTQLATIFAVAGGAVVVLYILKLRRRRVLVPFTRLWDRVLADRPTSSLFSKLKRLLSLLIQLALLALIVAALGDPRPAGAARSGRSLVVLVDGSASMKAVDVLHGRSHAAREALRRLVREMGPADRMLVAQMDAEVTALSPMTDDPAALESAVSAYAPRDTGLDFARALRFAQDATRGNPSPEVVVIGDGAFGEARDSDGEVRLQGAPLRFVPVGVRGRNVAITAFAVRRYPLDKSRYEVLVELRSFSDRPEEVELTLSADGAPIEVTRVTLPPGGSSQRVLPDLSGASQQMEARIAFAGGGHDDLPADDRAYATLPERRRARVLVSTPGNRYLEAALLLDEYLDVVQVPPAEAAARLRSARFDVAIFDGPAVAVPTGVGAIYLRPEGADLPVEADAGFVNATAGSAIGFTRVDRHHPLMRFTNDLDETHIGRIVRYRPRPEDRVLGQSAQGPLLIAGERGGDRFVLLSFDVRESDLPLLISWPVLLVNAIDWFAGEDPAYLSSFRTGETWRIPVPAGLDRATVETPSGRRVSVPVVEGRAAYFGTEAGFHRVHAGEQHSVVAGNLSDLGESRCAPQHTLTLSGQRATAPVAGRAGVRREWWPYLLLVALLVIAIEWATYHRRVTV
ncbi:MAG: VWA domain-containing protein [Polyangiales bacterium]